VLFGDVNPSGKLPVTFPRTAGMEPLYYNHKSTGRPKSDQKYTSKYIDVENTPLYPFGYGLNYTTFNYSGLDISSDTIRKDESVEVSVTVKNEGDVMGKEIVQLYIHYHFASITRTVIEMRKYNKLAVV